ncbi:sugar phosphate isomerase/epimerase [Frankia sp. EI5c]|uniref:sugar phosphate isomerase/epimerase family protein n=1 Tax=Frankia sp. EI5c TaxID=683316 RepID=UPI0007C23C0C|nr:sugar phosphate isomerase/epimerase [Frankia sp. EI5c]OAA27715.1 sugar phosphate isomerase/epimerase [Frankia sp. EI5c]
MTVVTAPTLFPLGHAFGAGDARVLVDAVAGAGFGGVQLTRAHLDGAVAGGMAPAEFIDLHRERGLTVATAEVLMSWAGADREAIVADATPLLDLAVLAGTDKVIAITSDVSGPSFAGVARRLAFLCDLAAERGLRISFEFLPWSVIPTLAAALRLLDAVDRENLGLVLDMWHWFRQPGGPDYDVLRAVPAERVDVVQLCDAPTRPADDLIMETMTARLAPGAGDIDIPAALDVLLAGGAAPVVATEVYSAPLAGLGPAEMSRRLFAATEKVLDGRFAEHS